MPQISKVPKVVAPSIIPVWSPELVVQADRLAYTGSSWYLRMTITSCDRLQTLRPDHALNSLLSSFSQLIVQTHGQPCVLELTRALHEQSVVIYCILLKIWLVYILEYIYFLINGHKHVFEIRELISCERKSQSLVFSPLLLLCTILETLTSLEHPSPLFQFDLVCLLLIKGVYTLRLY